jgi:sugar phosphate isomerase/epimerase
LSKAHEIASNFFQILVENLLDQNVRIALEPNAKEYGADYLTNYDEVLELVDLINSPAICAQIDTGCLEMEGYKPTDCVVRRRPEHVHLSRPGLNTIGTYEDYANLTALLKSKNYGGWVTFETLSDLQNSKSLNEISTVLSSLRDQF